MAAQVIRPSAPSSCTAYVRAPRNPETKKGRHEAGPLEWGGGDEEDRTPDLGIANAALSQLSYVPTIVWMIPPLWSIPNRQPRQLPDERPRRCGKRNTRLGHQAP